MQMLGGKFKNIEETIQKLVSVLATVILYIFSVRSIHLLCLPSQLQNSYPTKMYRPPISSSFVERSTINQNLERN